MIPGIGMASLRRRPTAPAYLDLTARTASIFLVADDYGPDPGKLQGRVSAGGSGGRHYRRDMWVSDTGGSAGYGNTNPTTVTHGGKQWLRTVGTSAGSLHTQMGGGGTSINFNTCFGKVAWTATIACKHDVLGPGPAGNPVASANIIGGFVYNAVFIGGVAGGLRFCALNNANSDWQPIYLPGAGALRGYGVIQVRFRAYNGPGDPGPDDAGELAMRWIPEGADPSTVSWVAIPPNGLFDTGTSPIAIAGVCGNPATGWQGEWHTIFVEQVYEDNTTANDVALSVMNLAGLSMTPPVDAITLPWTAYREQGRGANYNPAGSPPWAGIATAGPSAGRDMIAFGGPWGLPNVGAALGATNSVRFNDDLDDLREQLTALNFFDLDEFTIMLCVKLDGAVQSYATDACMAFCTYITIRAGQTGGLAKCRLKTTSPGADHLAESATFPLNTWVIVTARMLAGEIWLDIDFVAGTKTTGVVNTTGSLAGQVVRVAQSSAGTALHDRFSFGYSNIAYSDAQRDLARAWWTYRIGLR